MNHASLVGRLTKEPELRYTPNGVAVCSFTLAVNRPFSNQNGEQEADFIQIVVWRKPAENAANYLHKGSLAGVDGRIQTRNYENNEGRRVYVTEIVAEHVDFLEPKGTRNGNGQQQGGQNQNRQQNQQNGDQNQGNQRYNRQGRDQNGQFEDPFANNSEPINISDDDLPF